MGVRVDEAGWGVGAQLASRRSNVMRAVSVRCTNVGYQRIYLLNDSFVEKEGCLHVCAVRPALFVGRCWEVLSERMNECVRCECESRRESRRCCRGAIRRTMRLVLPLTLTVTHHPLRRLS